MTSTPEQPRPDRTRNPQAAGVIRRLFIAFILIAALTIAGRLIFPRVGLYLPLWVPVLAFVAIAAATLLVAWENRPRDDEPADEDIAGRIGRDEPPHDR